MYVNIDLDVKPFFIYLPPCIINRNKSKIIEIKYVGKNNNLPLLEMFTTVKRRVRILSNCLF